MFILYNYIYIVYSINYNISMLYFVENILVKNTTKLIKHIDKCCYWCYNIITRLNKTKNDYFNRGGQFGKR